MGDLTSFPLLSLVNYITFRYSMWKSQVNWKSIPVRINGDDIVFRATPSTVENWERDVAKGGLTLSAGKTMKDSTFFTLNSTLFTGLRKGVKAVPFVRSKAIWPEAELSEKVLSLNSRFYSAAVSMGRQRRAIVRRFFVRQNEKAVHASRRSITRGLGLDLDEGDLRSIGLWNRELFYLEQDREVPLPRMASGGVPKGFVKVSAHRVSPEMVKEGEDRFNSALLHYNWNEPYDREEYSEDQAFRMIREGCSPYGINHFNVKVIRKMLRLTRSQLWKWVYLRSNRDVFYRSRGEKKKEVWVHEDMLATLKQHVEFVKCIGT
jgi:hypothetical protein